MDSDGYPASYYAHSRHAAPERPPLAEAIAAEVCVVGGGFTGLSAALALAARGHRVTLLEGQRIGWGASGRNGGQIVNGLSAGLDTIERLCDLASARLVTEAGDALRGLIARHGIDCDLTEGNLFAALTAGQMRELEARKAMWARYGRDPYVLVDRAGMRAYVGSDAYLGGMADPTGGHLHPLNLALGEAAALERLGGVIHEKSPVTAIEDIAGRPVVRTPGGIVRPETLILAGNAYLGHLVPAIEDRIMPFSTQVLATEPLGSRAAALIPSGYCVEDERYVQDYYRLSRDGRLLFGGGAVFGGTDPADIRAKLVPHVEAVFPALRGARIEFAWSGNCALSYTRLPQLGRLGAASWFAQGYSGHGLVGSHLMGAILGDAVHGDRARFDAFAAAPWRRFPGGRRFAVPYTALGSWWYGLRDRLGL